LLDDEIQRFLVRAKVGGKAALVAYGCAVAFAA
jgi:hypothetical protein